MNSDERETSALHSSVAEVESPELDWERGLPRAADTGASSPALTPDEGQPETPQGVAWSHPSRGKTGDLGGPLSESNDGTTFARKRRKTSHRATASIPFSGAPYGKCRWCGEEILKPDGTQNRRRNWHPECIKAYKSTWPQAWRRAIHARDGGICALCLPADQIPLSEWDADHIVPLIDGGTWDIENGQTLCRHHHREKTAAENSDRARGLQAQGLTSATGVRHSGRKPDLAAGSSGRTET